MKNQFLAFLAGILLASAVLANAGLTVGAPWIRATVAQAKSTGAFMQLRSTADARLVQVRSSVAGTVEIHEMAMQGQTMKMHAIDSIDLPAGKPVNLASGGYHIMLMELKRQLKAGETVPMELVIETRDKRRETVALTVPVMPLIYSAPAASPASAPHRH